MTTALERIQGMEIAHRRQTSDFYIDQTKRAADVLLAIVDRLGVVPIRTVNEPMEDSDTLICGLYRASDILSRIDDLKREASA